MSSPVLCQCGQELHRIAVSEREWSWADATGNQTHSRYPFNPYERLNDLAATSPKDPSSGRRLEEYSRLVVDLDFGGWFQTHRPISEPPYSGPPAPPDHCNEPPYLAPHGWECRKCQQHL
jgi:hypothetical protein